MDSNPSKGGSRKSFIRKKLDRWLSMHSTDRSRAVSVLAKSKSWNCSSSSSSKGHHHHHDHQFIAPGGCFSVYVGPGKERFVVRAECANHPLFRALLEDAESEYGFHSQGPILLPCDVGLFCRVLTEVEMDGGSGGGGDGVARRPAADCGLVSGSCSPFNSPRRLLRGHSKSSYAILAQPTFLKMTSSS